jgi:acyl-CoA thioester hydrolase
LGVDQTALKAAQGIVFAVRKVDADYLKPAKFDDQLEVSTELLVMGGARIELRQEVWRGAERLFSAHVVLVCLHDSGQPARIPAEVRAALAPLRH